MDVSVSGTIDQKPYLKNLGRASAPLAPLWIRLCSWDGLDQELVYLDVDCSFIGKAAGALRCFCRLCLALKKPAAPPSRHACNMANSHIATYTQQDSLSL